MRKFRYWSVLLIVGLAVVGVSRPTAAGKIDPQKARASDDGKTLWYDCKDIGVEGKGWSDTPSFYDRLPAHAEGKASATVWRLSHHSTGMGVRFTTDAPSLEVRWTLAFEELGKPHMPATGVSGVDLYAKSKDGQWRFVQNGRPTKVTNTASFKPPAGAELLLYLPLYNGVKSVEIGIPNDRTLSTPDAAVLKQRKTIVFYGTSITQGGCASRPGMAFPSIVGRWLDVTILNLGFSGSGRMEPAMADFLAELNPTIYVLDTMGNMSDKEVSERAEPFVRKLRAARPDTPIVLVEDANASNRPTGKGQILQEIRDKLAGQGVKNLYFLSNQGMLGDDGEGTVDGAHPNDLGMMRHAKAFTNGLRPLLPPSP